MKELLPTVFAVVKGASLWAVLAGGFWLQHKLRVKLALAPPRRS